MKAILLVYTARSFLKMFLCNGRFVRTLYLTAVFVLPLYSAEGAEPSFRCKGFGDLKVYLCGDQSISDQELVALGGAVSVAEKQEVGRRIGDLENGEARDRSRNTHPFTYLDQPNSVTGPVVRLTTSQEAGFARSVLATGTGTNGPRAAQFGASISINKENWFERPGLTKPLVGEVDGVSVTVRQGGSESDAAGLLVDVQNDGKAFLAMSEMVSTAVNTETNKIMDGIDIQQGIIDEVGHNNIGVAYNMVYGTGAEAILVQNDVGASWKNVLSYNQGGHVVFNIDGGGNVNTAGSISGGVVKASGGVVKEETINRELNINDCGTLLRISTTSVRFMISHELPIGCKIDILQLNHHVAHVVSDIIKLAVEGKPSHTEEIEYDTIVVDSKTSAVVLGD